MANEFMTEAMYTAMQAAARNAIEGMSTSVSVSITYTQVTGRTVNPTSGASTPTENAVALTAFRADFASAKMDAGQGAGTVKEAGTVAFLIEARRLTGAPTPITEPRRQDRITEGSIQYEVTDWDVDAARLFFTVICSKVGT